MYNFAADQLLTVDNRPQIVEAAVVGLPSEQWGQKVAAVIVLNPALANTGRGGKTWGVMDMRRALKDRLVNYKIPQEMKVLEEIPKNAMGKSTFSEPAANKKKLTVPQLTKRRCSPVFFPMYCNIGDPRA